MTGLQKKILRWSAYIATAILVIALAGVIWFYIEAQNYLNKNLSELWNSAEQLRLLVEVVLIREADGDQLLLDTKNGYPETFTQLIVILVDERRNNIVDWNRDYD